MNDSSNQDALWQAFQGMTDYPLKHILFEILKEEAHNGMNKAIWMDRGNFLMNTNFPLKTAIHL